MTAPTAPGAADAARRAELAAALDRVRARIAAAGGADLLPVTKFHPAGDLALLADLGVRAVGRTGSRRRGRNTTASAGSPRST